MGSLFNKYAGGTSSATSRPRSTGLFEKYGGGKEKPQSVDTSILPKLRLQELPELTAAPSQYATWTGKKGGVDARGIDLEAGAADLEMRGQSLDVLNDYLEAAGVNLDRLERRASLTGAEEDVSAYESAFETYKAAAERARGEAANYDRLAGIYNEEARLQGMTTADMRAQIQENVRRLEKEADPEKIRNLQRSNENIRRRLEEIESQPTVEERLEEAYAREDELKKQVAAAERGLRRSGDVTELRRLQGDLEYVQNQIAELGGTADASWLKGAGQRYFGGMQEAIGILVKGEDNRQQESNIRAGEEALAEALEAAVMAEAAGRGDPAETARLRGIVDAIGQPGADKEKLLAEFLPGAAEVTEEVEKRNELAEAGRQAMQEEGAALTAKGEGNIEAAKGGRSAIEKTLIDIGVQGVNMALDAAIGNVTMLGGNVPLALRSFGGAAGQAVQEGASDAGAIGYGAASAAAEVLFGKLLDGAAGIYGKGAADDFVDHLVGKIAKTETGRKAWQILFASAGEGAEEVLTDLVDPALRLIYSGDSLGESYSKLEGADVAYDFMIGAIMGFFGGGIDAVSEPTASTQFFYDAAQNGMSFPQAVNAWKTLSADILKTETDRARELAKFDAEADRIVAQQVRGEQKRKAEAEAKEAEKSYFERLTTRSQANKIVNDETLKAEWQQKTGVVLEGAKGDQARTVMAESQKRLDAMNAEAATVSKTEEVGEPNAEKVVVAENATATETAETAHEAPQTQTATEVPVQRKAPTAARTAQEGRNDAKSAQQTIEILRGRDTDTAQYGGVEYSVYYDVDGTYTARAMRGDETLWTRSGLKNRTEAVNAMQSAREAGEIAGAGTGGAPGLVRNETYEKLRANKNITSRTVRELDYLARVIGSEIAIEETVTDSEGVSVNAKYSDGRISVAMDADDPLTVAVVHEAVHSIKESDEAAFKDLAGAVFRILANESDSFAQDFQNKARQYGWLDENGVYTENGEADTLEELVAQGMGIVAQNSDVLSRVTAQERSTIQRVLDAIHDLVEKIRGYTDYDADKGISREDAETYKTLLNHMEELQGKLEAALTDKSDSIEAKAVEMVGPETETERTPVSREEEAKYSTKRDEPLMDDADKYNDERGSVAKAVMEKAREQREFVKGLLSNESIQAMLPEDVEGNTVYSNSSYAKSAENSTVCPRSLVLDELTNAVSTALGRPLSFNEALYVTQMSANYTDKPECAYCYVAADRKMYTDMLGRYIQQRNAAVQAHKEGESLEWIVENIIGIKPGDAKRNTDKMKDRVKTWMKMADENKAFLSEADLAGFGNFAEDIKKRRESLAPELRAEFDLATKYAQSAARAKLRVKYAAYDGKILKMSPKTVSNLNSMYGLRMYSFTDFSPAFILENMQMFTDAAVKGLKVLAYTKEMEFAEIFASTGANINISVHGMKSPDAQGEFHMDAMQGADWERARALREQHPNVGITFVAESDAAVEWAMRQDWIDVVIPFHSVFGGGNLAAEIYGWKNYKQFQEDKKDSSLWKKGNAKSIYPAEHNNDLITYADALIKNGLTPRFPQWCNGFEQYRAGEIDADTFRLLNPNYMKLVNECRRSAKDTPAVQPIFDTRIAEEAIDTMVKRGGFYEQIGGSSENMQEIAGEIAGEIRQGKAEEMAANKRLEKWSRKAVTPEEMPTADTKYSLREIEQTAVDHFGTTTDFNEAGFILSNGEMLKFTDDNHRGERNYDHRAIGKAYGVDVDLSVNRGYNRESNRHLDDFVEKGGIRFDPGSLEFDFDAMMQMSKTVAPTAEQERAIRDFIEWKKQREEQYNPDDDPLSLFSGALALRIDFGGTSDVAISADRGELGIKQLTYEGGQINADRIIADIRHYYQTGETRKPSVVARFRYSRSNSDGRQLIRPIASEYLGDADYAVIKYLGASVSLKQNKRGEWVGMFMGGGHNGNVIAETREAALEELDAKMSEAYASAYEAPTDADRAEQAAWEGRETDLVTRSVTENRSLSRWEAEEIAEREGYPMLEDADGNERQAVPEYTWVQSRERGNYGLVTGMEIVDGVPMLNVWFENKARGTGMSVAMRPDEVIAVEGEMQTGRPEYKDEDAPPEADNTPPPGMWLPSEEEYKRQRELQESREETKREYQRMTADELTQQIIGQTPRQKRPESGVDISKIDVKEKQRKDAERIQLRRERAARAADRSAFTGTDEMKAAGIKVSGSLVRNWTNIQQLMQRNQAEKSINREYRKMLEKYNLRPSSPEVQFARGLANGTYTEADIPKRFNAGIVKDIANVERVRSQMKAETLREVKSDLNYREQEKAAIIFADSEKYRATPHGKVTKNFMNERTPERVLRSIYGAEKGAQIFNYLFRPVQENNAEAIRWVNKQKEDVSMRFVDSKNVQRDLTKAEKAYAQHIREGEGFAWQAAELEGYDLETYDAHMANFKELMELMKRDGYSDVIELVDAVNRGDMDRSEAEDRSANPELFREVLANRQAAISLPEMDSDLRKIVEGMQWYKQIEEEIKNNKEVDAVIIDNAADAIGEKYDEYYKIINQFLVAHGHDEIGFIPGYAPHMQPEPQRKAWGKALATLGIQLDEVSSLPAAIAGRTADFKPNMRWNPHFQHRLGGETDYNIVKGFESYLKFMSDILYHTDDIMRLRQVVNYFRTTYGSEEIAANLSAANAIRNASLEEKVNFLHGHTPDGYTPMFMSEANELIDRYVESQYADAENLSKYSEFVTWLENYANLLAGKQSLADRGLEYSGGRLLLNVSRKVMNAFMRANVAGSASSVLNQTAQLPMITTHLGPKYGYQAIRDILTGEVKKADWKNRSDFLTGKKGVDMLEMSDSKLDRFVDKLFTPAQMMDDIISTIAVRGEYLRQIDQGVSDEIALRRADDYARRVMGSRVKGEKPQGFESKRLFAQMAHVFQVEAANQFDYVTSDMPQAIRDFAEREGKVKAAKKVAAVATGYLLQAFLLNRLGEELYGGTPAPFDLFGMAAEFSAAGRDMSTERWLMQLVDNVMENHLGGERVFGTSEDEGAEEFDWANAMEASAYTISNDLPFIRNIAGIMGLGDESLPTVGINEVWQGAKGLWSGAKGDDGRFGGGDADWREIGESALDIAAQIAPGGRQLKKTATGLGTMIEGGSYSGNKLRYPVDGSAGKWVQALLFGTSALDETDEYYATNARNLSEKQTFVYKALVADGMQRQDAYEALQRYRELDGDKTLTAAEKANAKRDFITALPISDEAKLETWLDLVLDGEESSKYKTARELMDMGVQWMHVAAALNAQKSIDEGDGTASAKATEFAKWVDDYAEDHWLKEEAADLMKDGLAFWSMVKQDASVYEQLTDSGLTSAQAQDIYSLWASLKPDEGKKSVSEIQKMYALGAAKGLTDAQRYDATAGTLIDDTSLETESGNPSQYAKMLWCRDEGMSYADYVEAKNAGAIDNIYRFGTEAGADAESAYTMAMAVAALKPAPGKDEVSQGQKFEAIGKADVEDVYKMAVMEEWLEETTFKKLELAMGHGVSIELYGKAKQMLPKFDADGNGSYKQAEVENALRSMDISEKERAALWQAITNGKRNPFDRSVGTEMYKAYNAWNASRKK